MSEKLSDYIRGHLRRGAARLSAEGLRNRLDDVADKVEALESELVLLKGAAGRRYALLMDGDMHRYVVRDEDAAEFSRLEEGGDHDDFESFEARFGRCRLNHHESLLTFADPRDLDGEPAGAAKEGQ